MRVLIAEDDRVSRSLLERVLLKWGYEVAVTCDGEEAWQALQQDDAPSLVVLDWMMPGLDGLEVCRRVRELDVPNPPYLNPPDRPRRFCDALMPCLVLSIQR